MDVHEAFMALALHFPTAQVHLKCLGSDLRFRGREVGQRNMWSVDPVMLAMPCESYSGGRETGRNCGCSCRWQFRPSCLVGIVLKLSDSDGQAKEPVRRATSHAELVAMSLCMTCSEQKGKASSGSNL